MSFLLTTLKFIRIGKIIFNMTEDTLEIVNNKKLNNTEKGIEILKTIPDNVLELGKTSKKGE